LIIDVTVTDGYAWYGDYVYDIGDLTIEEARAALAPIFAKSITPQTIIDITESPRIEVAPGIIML
jgi:hypothetical protein